MAQPPFDILIREGWIVDGTGLPGYRADIGIAGGRIVWIGRQEGVEANEIIDASGHAVTPGFIDVHTHMDAQLFWDPLATSSSWHGVTSAVIGHCGFSLAPVDPDRKDLVVRNLERAEDMSARALDAGVPWGWSSFPDYLDAVVNTPMAINYAANIGHSALRTFVMGDRAFEAEASDDDLAEMSRLVVEAVRAGAFGFTTSRTANHETSDDKPVASRLATWEEVERLALAMSEAGGHVFQLVEDLPTEEAMAERNRQLLTLAAGMSSIVAISATSASQDRAFSLVHAAESDNGNIVALTHPRGIGAMMSFRTQLPFDQLPLWSKIRQLPEAEFVAALKDSSMRAQLVDEAQNGEYGRAIGAEARRPDFDRLQIMDGPVPPYETVGERAAATGLEPVEVMIQLALDTQLEQFFVQTFVPFDYGRVGQALAHPRGIMAFSDAGAHVSQMCDSSIQTHLLAHWVRDRQEIAFEQAIRMLTFAPARLWGLHDRGHIRLGAAADLNVLDPDTVAPQMPELVHDLPAGEPRIIQRATGIRATIVNGQVTLVDGAHRGTTPGRLLRSNSHS